jgi:hypothetical protein
MKSEIKSLGNGNYEFIAVPFSILDGCGIRANDTSKTKYSWNNTMGSTSYVRKLG